MKWAWLLGWPVWAWGCDGTVLSKGDDHFRMRADSHRAVAALAEYRAWQHCGADVGWRLGMVTQFVGHRLAAETDLKKRLFREGYTAALRATELDPMCGRCFFWAGINRALYGDSAGILQSLGSLKEVRQLLEKAAELDPAYAYGGPHRILALIDEKVPGLLGGSSRRAKDRLQRAVAMAPENPINYLFLVEWERAHGDGDEWKQRAREWFLKLESPPAGEVESAEAFAQLGRLAEAGT